jgi:hypothetical protein
MIKKTKFFCFSLMRTVPAGSARVPARHAKMPWLEPWSGVHLDCHVMQSKMVKYITYQGFPTNRNSLLGHQAKPGGATGLPTRHRGRQAELDPQLLFFSF